MLTHLQALQRAEEIDARINTIVAAGATASSALEELEELMGEVTCKWDAKAGRAWFNGLITDDHTATSFRKMLAAMKDRKELALHINSVGGSPMAGIAIHNMLAAAPLKITTISEGQAYSSASLVFMAGDKRLIAPSAIVGIHRPRRVAVLANADEMLAAAEQLEQVDQSMLEIYTAKCADDKADEIKAAMWQDTMIGLKRAEDLGLATGAAAVSAKKEMAATAAPVEGASGNAVEAVATEDPPADEPVGVSLAAMGIYGHL